MHKHLEVAGGGLRFGVKGLLVNWERNRGDAFNVSFFATGFGILGFVSGDLGLERCRPEGRCQE